MSKVYPSENAWITPRGSAIKITDQNCVIKPIQKIEKIDKLLAHTNADIEVIVYANAAGNYKNYSTKTSNIFYDREKTKPFSDFLDISHYVVSKEELSLIHK